MFIKTMVWLNGYDEVDPHAKYINIDWVTVIEPMVKGGLEISLINSHEDDASFYVVPPEYAPAFLEAMAKAEGVIDAAVKNEPEADKRPTAKHASIYEQHINDLAQAVLQVYPLGLPDNFNWDDAIEALRENAVDDEDAADDLSQHADHRVDVVRRVLELMEAQS